MQVPYQVVALSSIHSRRQQEGTSPTAPSTPAAMADPCRLLPTARQCPAQPRLLVWTTTPGQKPQSQAHSDSTGAIPVAPGYTPGTATRLPTPTSHTIRLSDHSPRPQLPLAMGALQTGGLPLLRQVPHVRRARPPLAVRPVTP